ncbi:hypothetical protein Cpir12675_001605 [Ceratocystis pirilliformis]|uniref:AB hydrolase-1 domain-containing protein n=1 Tax=Ceratocystis pirilliformis TaxID=259994 RepID=A0ABR3ZFB0_9PEZI
MMDYTIPALPPIPKQTRQHSRQKSLQKALGRIQTSTSHPDGCQTPQRQLQKSHLQQNDQDKGQDQHLHQRQRLHQHLHQRLHQHQHHAPVPPASPEVLNSLISSFAVIQKPSSASLDIPSHTLRPPPPPAIPIASLSAPLIAPAPYRDGGSFGVDYGAFHQPSLENLRADKTSPPDLAAAPPVIKTSKPPSGYSSLTAPRGLVHRDSSGGLKALLRSNSRPSSKSSSCSRDDGNQSIGNISIDCSAAAAASIELRRSRSSDSWGRKQGRNQKGLMYMSSKEQLREKEYEKKRASLGTSGGSVDPNSPTLRSTALLAEIPITEEHADIPALSIAPENTANSTANTTMLGSHRVSPGIDGVSPHQIPIRDSSLRKTGSSGVRRSSARNSRSSKRDSSSGPPHDEDVIPEHSEPARHRSDVPLERRHRRGVSSLDAGISRRQTPDNYYAAGQSPPMGPLASRSHTPVHRHVSDSYRPPRNGLGGIAADDLDDEEGGAPSPAVAQGRRRDDSSDRTSKRRSGRYSSDAFDGVKLKRSSSRLKRLSGSGSSSPKPDKAEKKRLSSQGLLPEPSRFSTGYERPQSADSIDDAVESYLCSPRLSQKIRHPQTGRVISFSEVGDSEGCAVFFCVGMGLTRYVTAFYDELALTLKLRLITPDRPGVGDSEPYSDGTTTPLSWPDDVYAICQALKISNFSILAHSTGAIYALATALRMPQHICGRIHLLAPWIPPSQMNVFGNSQALPPTNAIPTSQRILRALPTPFLKAANSSFMTATSSSITSSLPKTPRRKRKSSSQHRSASLTANQDKENIGFPQGSKPLSDSYPSMTATENMDRVKPGLVGASGSRAPETNILNAAFDALSDKERQKIYDERLTYAIWQLATTGANPAVDLLVCLERRHTIGFRYVDITRPIVIHHGSRDTRVPIDNVRWLGKTLRRCEVRVLEGESHSLMASATVMGSVLMEISKEWDDWIRASGPGSSSGGPILIPLPPRSARVGILR